MNYESIFEENLISMLKEKFHIVDTKRLLVYLITRFHCVEGKYKKFQSKEFMSFLLDEIAVSCSNSSGVTIRYDGEEYELSHEYALENSLTNIFDSIMFNLNSGSINNENGLPIQTEIYIKNAYDFVVKDAKHKILDYKTSTYYSKLLILFKLKALNKYFNIESVSDAPVSDFFHQLPDLSSKETLYERYLHATNFETTNVKSVTESQVRDYLYANLSLIEDGLKPISREYQTEEGRVDILAIDSNGNVVIIEIKTENDKRLVWQCMYYPDQIKKKFPGSNVIRMITVAPEYPEYLLNPIQKLGYVECYSYGIVTSNNKIEEMVISRVEKASNTKKIYFAYTQEIEVPCDATDEEIDAKIRKQLPGSVDYIWSENDNLFYDDNY